MNKRDLVGAVNDHVSGSEGDPITKADVEKIIDATFSIIGDVLVSGNDANGVNIAGFGKFESKYQKARQARNPATGETVSVAAKYSPKFKAAKTLKDAVAGV